MDQFEAAKRKHAKNLERRTRPLDVVGEAKTVYVEPEDPKEKNVFPMTDAVIDVSVSLPGGNLSFTLVKQSVAQNAVMSKLTRQAFLNAVMNGIEPLLGTVKER